MLNLSRNLGLITGASLMGAVFALGAATRNIMTARPDAVAVGMRLTFMVAAMLVAVALVIASTFGRKRGITPAPLSSLRESPLLPQHAATSRATTQRRRA
jgi:hypothetical protein